MGTGKVLGGVAFLILGIVILVIGIVPIPGLGISLVDRIFIFIATIMDFMATFNIELLLVNAAFMSLAIIFPWVGIHYIIAGIKSMRYDKPKKEYYVSTTKIGFLIAGFILICVAASLILMIVLGFLDPSFQFIVGLTPPWLSFPGLLPHLLIPIVLTMLIIFFIYWIGSKIMKHGVKKEELF